MGGDGLLGAVAGRAARHGGRARRPARRARERLRAQARHRRRPGGGLRRAGRGRARGVDVADARRPRLPRHRLGRVRLRRAGHRQRARGCRSARLVYAYGTLRALRALAARALDGRRSTARRTRSRGYSVAVANSGVFGGGMRLVPDARARRRPARRRAHRATSPGALPRQPAEGVQGQPRQRSGARVPARPRGRLRRRPAVRRLRGRRPDRRRCRPPSGSRPRALRVLAP